MARILIVDDSIVMRRNLRSLLEEAGHTIVGESIDGQQAYFDYRRTKPDLVTMDITMPKVDGIDALKNIIDNFPSANIIMISALDQKAKVFSALRNGAKHYIIKPIESKKVLSVINEVISNDYANQNNENKKMITSKQGFEIANVEGKFVISFNEALDQSDYTLLNMAVKGILFIKPLKVVFNFLALDYVDDKVLLPIVKLANEVIQSGGEINYVASDALKSKLNI